MPTVASAMNRDIKSLDPRQTVAQAARAMRDLGVGALPVCEGDKFVGMLSQRDIVSRVVAAGKSAESCLVERLLGADARCVGASEDLDDVLIEMSQVHERLMPVVDAHMRLVGMVSISEIERETERAEALHEAALVDALRADSEWPVQNQKKARAAKRKLRTGARSVALIH